MYSFIVSIYKVEKYLSQCIESILSQTYRDFEVILVDDGSPDQCPQICDEYAAKDNRLKVIHKENGGLMSTRKIGVSAASGDYICFVDGDDFISSDMLETYEAILNKYNVDIICNGYSSYFEQKTDSILQRIPLGYYDKERLKKEVYPRMLSTEPFFSFFIIPSVCSKCFKRSIVKKIYSEVPDDISLGEDVAASYPAILESESIYVTDYTGYMYRQNYASMTHTYDKNLYQKICNLILHLRNINEEKDWNADCQIDEYTVYLLYLARNNELSFNHEHRYKEKKNKFNQYLQNDIFLRALRSVRMNNKKDKFLVFCFRHKLIMPLYLWSCVRKL